MSVPSKAHKMGAQAVKAASQVRTMATVALLTVRRSKDLEEETDRER